MKISEISTKTLMNTDSTANDFEGGQSSLEAFRRIPKGNWMFS